MASRYKILATNKYPDAWQTNWKIVQSNGTIFAASAFTVDAPWTTWNVMQSDWTNWKSAAPTWWSSNNLVSAFTAWEDITAGNSVWISMFTDNYVWKYAIWWKSVATWIWWTLAGQARRDTIYCPIWWDKFVHICYNNADSDTIFAQVWTVNKNAWTVTLWTASAAATGLLASTGSLFYSVNKLDTDKFIVFYVLDWDASIVKARVGTVSWTTISRWTEATAFDWATNIWQVCSDQIWTDKWVLVCKCATTVTNSKAIVYTVSWTTATFWTPASMWTTWTNANTTTRVKQIWTDKFVVVCILTTNSVYAQVWTCTSTTDITFWNEVQIITTVTWTTDYHITVWKLDTDKFIVKHTNGSNTRFTVCTVSWTTPTAGTWTTVSNNYASTFWAMYVKSATECWFSASTYWAWKVTISWTDVTDRWWYALTASMVNWCMIPIDNWYFVLVWLDTASANLLYQVQWCMPIVFIWAAQATVSGWDSVNVIVRWIDANQTNLMPWAFYWPDWAGWWVRKDNSATTDTPTEIYPYVKALSSTSILI